jgi:hypothetical protein
VLRDPLLGGSVSKLLVVVGLLGRRVERSTRKETHHDIVFCATDFRDRVGGYESALNGVWVQMIIIPKGWVEAEERARRFIVHKNYVSGLAQFAEHEYAAARQKRLEALLRTQEALDGFKRISRSSSSDIGSIRQFLTIGWASELQLALTYLRESPNFALPWYPSKSGRTLLRFANAWTPVHMYYAIYMSGQAWLTSMGMKRSTETHAGTLRTISQHITARSLLPFPWCVGCLGCPHVGEATYMNLPSGINPAVHVELLSSPSLTTFWPRFCKMLETTRRRQLDGSFAGWKQKNKRKRMRAEEKRAVAERLSATTVFDYLWRLRVRCNYRDVESMLTVTTSDSWHWDFFRSMFIVMDSTCTLLQSLVLRYVGDAVYEEILQDFVRWNGLEGTNIGRFFESRLRLLL